MSCFCREVQRHGSTTRHELLNPTLPNLQLAKPNAAYRKEVTIIRLGDSAAKWLRSEAKIAYLNPR